MTKYLPQENAVKTCTYISFYLFPLRLLSWYTIFDYMICKSLNFL